MGLVQAGTWTYTATATGQVRRSGNARPLERQIFPEHPLDAASATRSLVALSGADAEFYACNRGTAGGLQTCHFLTDAGYEVISRVCSDSSACRGIVRKTSTSRTRHWEIWHMWTLERTPHQTSHPHATPHTPPQATHHTHTTTTTPRPRPRHLTSHPHATPHTPLHPTPLHPTPHTHQTGDERAEPELIVLIIVLRW